MLHLLTYKSGYASLRVPVLSILLFLFFSTIAAAQCPRCFCLQDPDNSNDDIEITAPFITDPTICDALCVANGQGRGECRVLPVELINFDAQNIGQYIQLYWNTASELNNAGFEVQYSSNGKDWEIITFIEGNGTSLEAKYYQWNDPTPHTGLSYYRLRQVDIDGSFEYSPIVSIHAKSTTPKELLVQPNPAHTHIVLNTLGIDTKEVQNLQIFDTFGRLVYTQARFYTQKQAIQIDQLPRGTYMILARIQSEVLSTRFQKL